MRYFSENGFPEPEDTRCEEGCPHLTTKRANGKAAAFCTFYKKRLFDHNVLNGVEACGKCRRDCGEIETEDDDEV